MLKVLRDNLKYLSWILWVVILVFIAFVFVDFGGGLTGGATSGPAATVGGKPISMRQFQREYRRIEDRYRQSFGGQIPQQLMEQLQLPRQALNGLVDRELLVAEARRAGLRVTDEELRNYLLSQPMLVDETGRFVGGELYERFVRSLDFANARDFEEAVRGDLAIQKLTENLAQSITVADSEVEADWREVNEHASLRYLFVPATRHTAAVTVTDEQARAWFEKHRDEFQLDERRSVDYLLVDSTRLRESLSVSDADVAAWYEANRSEFERPEEVQARHILIKIDENREEAAAQQLMGSVRQRLNAGESFAELAGELSEDPGSRANGGDLGWFGRGRMIAEFEQAAFGATPGSVVGPVRTSFGLHLIEVLDHRQGGVEPLEQAAARIRARLLGERAREAAAARATELARRIADEKRTDEAAWRELADDTTVTLVTTPLFGRNDMVPGVGRSPEFIETAFALAAGSASTPVAVPRGWAVLRLREEQPAHAAEFEEVEAQVRAAAEREQAAALALAELAAARVADGAGLDALASRLGLEVATAPDLSRNAQLAGHGPAREIVEAALALTPGSIGGPVTVTDGAVLFEVTEVAPFDPAAFAAARDEIRDRLREEEAGRLLASLLAERRQELGVTYDRALVEQFGLGI